MNANTLPEAEVLALLAQIEAGEVLATPIGGPPRYFDCVVRYTTPCGWELAVFNDVGEWDYLEEAIAPDGRVWSYGDAPWGAETPLMRYQPPEALLDSQWAWNGWCK